MNLNRSEWKEFYIIDLFTGCKRGTRIATIDRVGGGIPFVTAGESNEGVSEFIGNVEAATYTNALTIDMFGNCFYHGYDFKCDDNILVCTNQHMNCYIGLFLSNIITADKYKNSYGRQYRQKDYMKHVIKLPIQHNSDGTPYVDPNHTYSEDGYVPDWQFMEDYMKSLHHKPLTTKNTVGNGLALNVDEWKEFRVGDLFDLKPTKGKDSTELLDGDDISYIGAKKEMNGFMMRCQLDGFEEWVSDGNCIVFVCLGAGSAGYTTYQKDDFIGMSGKTICGYNKNLNPIIGNFLVTILDCERPKYSFGRSWTGDRLKNTIIKLPIKHNSDGTPYIDLNCTYSEDGYVPDWQFMEEYMKALPYGDRL